jgi:4-oxalocrotonate tautomerase
MPIVTVDFLPGRSEETKQRLAQAITNAMVDIAGGTRDHCWVLFRETAPGNWAIGGNLLTSEAFAETVNAYNERMAKKAAAPDGKGR